MVSILHVPFFRWRILSGMCVFAFNLTSIKPTYVSMVVYNTDMEIANELRLRVSRAEDASAMRQLMETAAFTHWHVDWRVPGDWLGTPFFVVAENGRRELVGGLLAAADPPPAGWVRMAAFRSARLAQSLLYQMLAMVTQSLQAQNVHELAWLLPVAWPETWLSSVGFQPGTSIISMLKPDLVLPHRPVNPDIHIRPVHDRDLPTLVDIEAAAFAPLWRHSLHSLELGRQASFTFTVAEWAGRVMGFQYSTHSQTAFAAHLVRMTVSPQAQGQGIGSALMTEAITTYREQGLQQVTLNTQIDNLPSQRLYAKFGFHQAGPPIPVWVCPL